MAAGLLMVVVVFLAIQVDDDIAEFLGYFDFNSLSRELVPNLHEKFLRFRFLSKRRKHSCQNGCRNKTAASMDFFHSIPRLQLTRVVGSCVYLVVPQGTTRPSGIRGCGILR